MKYSVATIRAAGLSAKWGRNSAGAPLLFARDDSKGKAWYAVARDMWQAMQSEGVKPAFERFTLLGDIFSLPA